MRGRSGVKVDNNLGRFDVTGTSCESTAARRSPASTVSVRIAPGGVIGLGGREIKVRRGTFEFTGDPAVDPIVEIVPGVRHDAGRRRGRGPRVDPTLMATRGLAQGLSSVLGFENETLRPADIAGQIERDPSVNFMVGQRLNRNLALFLSANLTDVQDRMTMLQGWNFRGLRGLVAAGLSGDRRRQRRRRDFPTIQLGRHGGVSRPPRNPPPQARRRLAHVQTPTQEGDAAAARATVRSVPSLCSVGSHGTSHGRQRVPECAGDRISRR